MQFLNDRKSKIRISNLMLCIYKECIEGLEQFYKESLNSFDAQVGETSCQIRAYKILLLHSLSEPEFNRAVLKVQKIYSLKEKINYPSL